MRLKKCCAKYPESGLSEQIPITLLALHYHWILSPFFALPEKLICVRAARISRYIYTTVSAKRELGACYHHKKIDFFLCKKRALQQPTFYDQQSKHFLFTIAFTRRKALKGLSDFFGQCRYYIPGVLDTTQRDPSISDGRILSLFPAKFFSFDP